MPNYLEFFPRPLLVDLCENQVLPFIGSGFSLNAITPPGRRMPLIDQIAACLNELMPEFTGMSIMDIISEFDVRFGRTQFAEELDKMLLVGVAQPGPAHLAFARLPFDLVVTTNVEQLLEEAWLEVGRFPQVIMFDDQLPAKVMSDDPVTLLKIHGDVNFPDRLIWTEQDYDTFIARFPLLATYLASLLITHTPLFIGYSVDDYDFRQIWNIIGQRLGRMRRRAYAIEVSATPSMIMRYERRGVEVVNLPGSRADFGPILTETFQQLRRFLANGCPPPGIPPCEALGVPLDIDVADGDDPPDGFTGDCVSRAPECSEPDDDCVDHRPEYDDDQPDCNHRYHDRWGVDTPGDCASCDEPTRGKAVDDCRDDSSGSGLSRSDEERRQRARRHKKRSTRKRPRLGE